MEKHACIVIWYKPSKEIIEKWNFIIKSNKEYSHFIIVDNTPKDSIIENNESKLENCTYIRLNQNLGIAEAQNIGIKKVLEKELNYIFFFDQDSEIPPNYFQKMIEAYGRIRSMIQTPLILGPKHLSINQNINYKASQKENIDNFSTVDSILSSGTLLNKDVINQVGFMMAPLFIDQVDHEYCYRALSKKIPTIVNNEITLHHQIGNKVVHLLGANFIISAPFRYYYQFRNAIILLKLDYVKKRIKRKLIIRKVIDFFIQPILNYPNTISVFKYITRGVKDGFKYKVK